MRADRDRFSRRGGGGRGGRSADSLSLWGGAAAQESQGDRSDRSDAELVEMVTNLARDGASSARALSARFAVARRERLGIEDDALTLAAGLVWSAADLMVRAQVALDAGQASRAQEAAHEAAETLRQLRGDGSVAADVVDLAIGRAGAIWSKAEALGAQQGDTNGQAHDGYAVWTTGKPRGWGDVTSRELDRDGNWDQSDWLTHHSDRSDSWAARNIRNGKNQDLQAYDFTFERQNARGEAIAGTAQGLELISPWDAKVHDVNHSLSQSGGYGKFIALEDLETGLRFEVHHLDSVADVRIGGTVNGGDVIGTQGATGRERYSFATHVDIVGTAEAVEQFVRANQSGRFKSNKRQNGA